MIRTREQSEVKIAGQHTWEESGVCLLVPVCVCVMKADRLSRETSGRLDSNCWSSQEKKRGKRKPESSLEWCFPHNKIQFSRVMMRERREEEEAWGNRKGRVECVESMKWEWKEIVCERRDGKGKVSFSVCFVLCFTRLNSQGYLKYEKVAGLR